jgi:hypothetical protein
LNVALLKECLQEFSRVGEKVMKLALIPNQATLTGLAIRRGIIVVERGTARPPHDSEQIRANLVLPEHDGMATCAATAELDLSVSGVALRMRFGAEHKNYWTDQKNPITHFSTLNELKLISTLG